jgi:uncharacterized protein DUF551
MNEQPADVAIALECWTASVVQMPRDHQHVLGWITSGSLHHGEDYMDIVMYLNGIFRMHNGEEDEPVLVTHWMPLPPPPISFNPQGRSHP